MERASSFEDLRRLARCVATLDGRAARRWTARLGGLALPLLLRELASDRHAELARGLIFDLVAEHPALRTRVLRALHALAVTACDRTKAVALGLLGELGVTAATASFDDPDAVQRRSAAALAEQLATDADVAAAADLMTKRLDAGELVSLLEIMTETAPEQAARLVNELSGRVDLEGSLRSDVRRVAAAAWVQRGEQAQTAARRPRRSTVAAVMILADGRGSQVVVAVRRRGAQRRWRRFAVLIGPDGVLEDCLYEEDVPASELGDPMTAPLIRGLLSEGYQVLSDDPLRGHAVAAAAARRAATIPQRLTSAYYLGRDILELGDLHLGPRNSLGEVATAIGRAVDLFAAGEVARAKELAAHCARVAPDNADVASTLGLCHLASDELTSAAQWLGRAAAAEPSWPMHHWNLAAVHHRADSASACAEALEAFLHAADRCAMLQSDSDQLERVAMARRYLAAHRPSEPVVSPARARRARRLLRDTARTQE